MAYSRFDVGDAEFTTKLHLRTDDIYHKLALSNDRQLLGKHL